MASEPTRPRTIQLKVLLGDFNVERLIALLLDTVDFPGAWRSEAAWHEQFKAIIVQGLRARGWQTSRAEKFVADAERLVTLGNKGPVVVPEQEKKL